MQSSSAISTSLQARPASWNTHFLLAHDLHFLDEAAYGRLNAATVEVKRMLSALVRKRLNAWRAEMLSAEC